MHVVGDEEVEVAVGVVVEEAGTAAPAGIVDADSCTEFVESAAVIAVNSIGTVVGDKEILVPVGIVVGSRDAKTVVRICEFGNGRDVGEVTIAAISIEFVGGQGIGRITLYIGAVDQIEV